MMDRHTTMMLISIGIALVYVASVHVATRLGASSLRSRSDSRSDPAVIKRRVAGVALATLFSVAAASLATRTHPADLILGAHASLSKVAISALVGAAVPSILFFGHLVRCILQGLPVCEVCQEDTILIVRALIAAPISEEICFRSCMVPLFKAGGFTDTATIFTLPLVFGLAHLHHIYDSFRERAGPKVNFAHLFLSLFGIQKRFGSDHAALANQSAILTQILLQSIFQFAYTTVFGWIATWLLIRTGGGAIAPIVAHTLCNGFGFPDLSCFAEFGRDRKQNIIGISYFIGLSGFFALLTFM
ncbi:hypothetical protein BC830DRAFT_1142811 [Chytriomyces sp. MP71]|nr:hypothetical protein BC830DRAFT_1142811 [Chytriomyces sp. MP71]